MINDRKFARPYRGRRLWLGAALLALGMLTTAHTARLHAAAPEYERRELTIPMRDGVRLFAVALVPKAATKPLPILLVRTPFNAAHEFKNFWDEEDVLGPQISYRTVERQDRRGLNRIVMGPWAHRGWSLPGGDSLGPLRFGTRTADHFREQIQRPWFAYYLHDEGDGRFPDAWAFESGSNQWRTFDAWPPKTAVRRRLYLGENGTLSFDPPGATADGREPFDAYRSDPDQPVPNAPRPDDGSNFASWMLQDQRFVDDRPDVVTWVSAPLAEDLTIAGDVTARLFASTSGSDADWVVKLIDVFPEETPDRPSMGGYQFMVNADIMRGRYWKGFEKAVPIPPDTVLPFTVDLHQQLYRFLKGHRLMVQVQSSWFPLYDRNPQRFVDNIFDAKPSDFRAAEHRIWRSPRYPSHVEVQVLP